MKKVSQIRNSAETFCGVAIDDDVVIKAINDAIDEIADLAIRSDIVRLNGVLAGQWIPPGVNGVPERATKIRSVKKDTGEIYEHWQSDGFSLMFQDAGNYDVFIERMPNEVTSLSDIPDVHPVLFNAITDYVKAYVKLAKDDQSPAGLALKQGFYDKVKRAYHTLENYRKR